MGAQTLDKEAFRVKEGRDLEEARFQIIKAMLEEFPDLRRRVREHLSSSSR